MEIFINERSLHSQYLSIRELTDAVVKINDVLMCLVELPGETAVFFHRDLYLSKVIGDYTFSAGLQRISEKSVRTQFKVLLNHLNAACWDDRRLQENCAYLWEGINISDSSIAELCERMLQKRNGCLIGFLSSNFPSGCSIPTSKLGGTVDLTSFSDRAEFIKWCRLLSLYFSKFTPSSGRPPNDEETALRDRGRFRRTPYVNQGRTVYQELKTSRYYCVDNLHIFGAHLEVFDAGGNHLGEASLDGTLDRSKVDLTKELYL